VLSGGTVLTRTRNAQPEIQRPSRRRNSVLHVHSCSIRGVRIITDDRCTGYHAPGHPERPERIRATSREAAGAEGPDIQWAKPGDVPERPSWRAHAGTTRALSVAQDFDTDTAWHEGIAEQRVVRLGPRSKP